MIVSKATSIFAHFSCFVQRLDVVYLINVNKCARLQEIQNNLNNFAAKNFKSI